MKELWREVIQPFLAIIGFLLLFLLDNLNNTLFVEIRQRLNDSLNQSVALNAPQSGDQTILADSTVKDLME